VSQRGDRRNPDKKRHGTVTAHADHRAGLSERTKGRIKGETALARMERGESIGEVLFEGNPAKKSRGHTRLEGGGGGGTSPATGRSGCRSEQCVVKKKGAKRRKGRLVPPCDFFVPEGWRQRKGRKYISKKNVGKGDIPGHRLQNDHEKTERPTHAHRDHARMRRTNPENVHTQNHLAHIGKSTFNPSQEKGGGKSREEKCLTTNLNKH